MKRKDLIKHLRASGCVFVREGSEHSIWENTANGKRTSIPRHREILSSLLNESANSLRSRKHASCLYLSVAGVR
jgi:mRNA interferase HicA